MTVSEILDKKGRETFRLVENTSVEEVLNVLADKRIGAILIVHADDSIAGILSERDIVRALANRGASVLEDTASQHMTRDVKTCSESDAITKVMEVMSTGRFRHIPVVEDGRLCGVISIGDVVKKRIEQAEKEAEDIRSYISAV